MKLTVAKERPEVPDVTTGNPTVEEATQTLEEAGYKVATDAAPDPALVGRVIGQRPEAGHAALDRRDGHDRRRCRRPRDADAAPRRPPTP